MSFKRYIGPKVQSARWQKYITSPYPYLFLEKVARLWRPGKLTRHVRISVQCGLRLLRLAYGRSRPVVWTNVYTPPELIWAMGGIPLMPEVIAAVAADLGWSNNFLQSAEGTWYSTDLCSFHRCALGMAVARVLPRPDVIVATSHLCDGAVKFLEMAGRMYGCPYYLLHIPYRDDNYSRSWLAGELAALSQELKPLLPSSEREISLVAGNVNSAREQMLAVNELRRNVPAPWRGDEALGRVVMFLNMLGARETVDFYRTLRQELEYRVKKGLPVAPEQKYRLLWLHFKPFYANSLMDLLECKRGGVIAFEEVNAVTWDRLSLEDWWGSMAARILTNPLWGPGERRVDLAMKLVCEYKIDGVIHFSHWGCRQSTGMVSLFREAFGREKIPFLNLEGDCVDPRNFMEGQSATRVESFLEILEPKGV